MWAAPFPIQIQTITFSYKKKLYAVFTWIFDGTLNPIAYTPLSSSGFLKYKIKFIDFEDENKNINFHVVVTIYTYSFSASNDFTEYNGEFGSFRWISRSCLDSTKPFRIIFRNRLESAALHTSGASSASGFDGAGLDFGLATPDEAVPPTCRLFVYNFGEKHNYWLCAFRLRYGSTIYQRGDFLIDCLAGPFCGCSCHCC